MTPTRSSTGSGILWRGWQQANETLEQLNEELNTANTMRMLWLVDDLLVVSRATAQALASRPEDIHADDGEPQHPRGGSR